MPMDGTKAGGQFTEISQVNCHIKVEIDKSERETGWNKKIARKKKLMCIITCRM